MVGYRAVVFNPRGCGGVDLKVCSILSVSCMPTADIFDLANSSENCCALGEFLTKLWSAMQVHYACTAIVC